MKRVLGVRSLVVALTVVAGLIGLFATMPETEAIIGVCTYYSNAKYKTVVGQRGTGCCGETISWGEVTPYRRCEQVYCLDVWCPPPEI